MGPRRMYFDTRSMRSGSMHFDDISDVCATEELAVKRSRGAAESCKDPCGGLCGVRNGSRDARWNRLRNRIRGFADPRSNIEIARHRGEMSGTSNANIRSQHSLVGSQALVCCSVHAQDFRLAVRAAKQMSLRQRLGSQPVGRQVQLKIKWEIEVLKKVIRRIELLDG